MGGRLYKQKYIFNIFNITQHALELFSHEFCHSCVVFWVFNMEQAEYFIRYQYRGAKMFKQIATIHF